MDGVGVQRRKKGDEHRIEIRCSRDTLVKFRKIAAEFDDYEHLIHWLIENFETFRGLRGIVLKNTLLDHGVL